MSHEWAFSSQANIAMENDRRLQLAIGKARSNELNPKPIATIPTSGNPDHSDCRVLHEPTQDLQRIPAAINCEGATFPLNLDIGTAGKRCLFFSFGIEGSEKLQPGGCSLLNAINGAGKGIGAEERPHVCARELRAGVKLGTVSGVGRREEDIEALEGGEEVGFRGEGRRRRWQVALARRQGSDGGSRGGGGSEEGEERIADQKEEGKGEDDRAADPFLHLPLARHGPGPYWPCRAGTRAVSCLKCLGRASPGMRTVTCLKENTLYTDPVQQR